MSGYQKAKMKQLSSLGCICLLFSLEYYLGLNEATMTHWQMSAVSFFSTQMTGTLETCTTDMIRLVWGVVFWYHETSLSRKNTRHLFTYLVEMEGTLMNNDILYHANAFFMA
ncbi:hypothetical protein BD560DRAFT_399623 [Blakeslea trispora]|nr:hypothetical protein BD560DRAFT_399623 [Blakeslea trispora]